MKLIRTLNHLLDRTLYLMFILAGFLLVFSMLSISIAVASRYLLGRPIGWVVEICEYILLYMTFMIAAWVLKGEGHVRMDLVLSRLNPRTQSLMNAITSGISAIVCFILAWFGIRVTWELFKTKYFTPTLLELPKSIIVAIISVGSILLLLQLLQKAFVYRSTWKTSKNPEGKKS